MYKYTEEEIEAKIIDIINKYPIKDRIGDYVIDVNGGYGGNMVIQDYVIRYKSIDVYDYTILPLKNSTCEKIYDYVGKVLESRRMEHIDYALDKLMEL
jgi:hypothetical protein